MFLSFRMGEGRLVHANARDMVFVRPIKKTLQFDEFIVDFQVFHGIFSETPLEMAIETVPLTLPPSADPSKFSNFGRQVIGVDPENLSPSEFVEIQDLLYKVPLKVCKV